MVALGLTRPVGPAELREAALDGSIEEMLNWRPVKAGDFLYVPAGTIHTVGPGICLFELQQNADVTYRLYDHGRPRELQIDDAIAVANAGRWEAGLRENGDDCPRTLVDGPHFRVVLTNSDALENSMRWIIPVKGQARAGEDRAEPGECLLLQPGEQLDQPATRMLIASSR